MPADTQSVADTLVDPARDTRVSDIAVVRDLPVSTDYARVNGRPVVLVSIQQTTSSNAVAVVRNVKELLHDTKLPAGYEISFSNDTTAPVQASLISTYREILVTAIVVALIILLFLGKLNTALSVIIAVPIALSAAPVLFNLAGFTLNLVSMLAMIVAIGVVVDDSIVVAENVERYRLMGFGQREAVLKGASEIFSAVVAATLSLLSVLIPVSFIGGIIGQFMRQFALGLAAAVAFSLLEAVLFLTVRLAYTPESTRTLDWSDLGRSVGKLGESMRWGLRAWRKAAGIVVGIAALVALIATKHFVFLPALLLYPFLLGLLRYVGRSSVSFFQALTTTLHGWTEAGLEWVRDEYAKSLVGMLDRSVLVLVGTAVALPSSWSLVLPKITFSFAPQSDNGSITINVSMHNGTTLAANNEHDGQIGKLPPASARREDRADHRGERRHLHGRGEQARKHHDGRAARASRAQGRGIRPDGQVPQGDGRHPFRRRPLRDAQPERRGRSPRIQLHHHPEPPVLQPGSAAGQEHEDSAGSCRTMPSSRAPHPACPTSPSSATSCRANPRWRAPG